MNDRRAQVCVVPAAVAVVIGALLVFAVVAAAADPASRPATQPAEHGPGVVMLDELKDLFEGVPFDHRSHAQMAAMGKGCETCHHYSPDALKHPECKSCHVRAAADKRTLRQPTLKGAYHRQCLNCHREWSGANQCGTCHQPRGKSDIAKAGGGGEGGNRAVAAAPTPDDVTGRMHPPIPEPETKQYRARFTPADGPNVLFRHKEHIDKYQLKCVTCHHEDNCTRCHSNSNSNGNGNGKATTTGVKPSDAAHAVANGNLASGRRLKQGLSWKQAHDPCITCHGDAKCSHCHYKDGQPPPAPGAAPAKAGNDKEQAP
jgi:hypothetical protein